LTIVRQVLAPIAREFQPDILFLSAGFDCAQGDPLGGMEVSSDGFGHLTRALMQSVPQHSRVVMALEGGYNVRAVSEGVVSCVRALLGDDLPPLDDSAVSNAAFMGKRELAKLAQKRDLFLADLDKVVQVQRKYWKCMKNVQVLPQDVAARLAKEEAAASAAAAAKAAAAAAVMATASVASVTINPPPNGAPVVLSSSSVVSVTVAAAAPLPVASAPVQSLSVASAAEALASLAMQRPQQSQLNNNAAASKPAGF
jgi:hypothetical protein